MDVYNNPDDSKDVFKQLEASEGEKNGSTSGGSDTFAVIFWNFVIVGAGAGVVVYFNNKNKNEILETIKGSNKSKK